MGSFPYGPHGPECSPTDVRPNPTKPSAPGPQFGEETYPSPAVYTGGGGGGIGAIIANFLFSLLFLFCVWEAFVCLYPLTAISGIAAGLVTAPFLARLLPPDNDVAAVIGIFAGAVAGYVMIRVEYRLAQSLPYRVIRHAVRLVLLAVLAVPVIQIAQGAYVPNTTTRYILSVVLNPRRMAAFLAVPQNDAILLVAVIALHFLLWNGEPVRRFWHTRLSAVGMK